MKYEKIEDVSVYLGPACNFNCEYCDRAYVKTVKVGAMEADPELIDFLVDVVENSDKPMVSFHGGEPLVYVKTMDAIIDAVMARVPLLADKIVFYLQTNGSLIITNAWFFEKHKSTLHVSMSYDFYYQGVNRTEFDIETTLGFLNSLNIDINLQYVIPTNKRNVFSMDVFTSIVTLYRRFRINRLILILLRHIRHKDRFETVIADDAINLDAFFAAFIQFVQLLYVSKINVVIDGHDGKIDKEYFGNHKQMVLAPNGEIVPEYQFIEYGQYDFTLGRWKDQVEVKRNVIPIKAEKRIRNECFDCPQTELCGLRYHYAMFNIDPPDASKCRKFYALNTIAIRHLFKLKQHRSLLESIGV